MTPSLLSPRMRPSRGTPTSPGTPGRAVGRQEEGRRARQADKIRRVLEYASAVQLRD